MIIETYLKKDIKIIKVLGEVAFDNYAQFAANLLKGIEDNKDVLLDLKDLTYLNSMGLSVIMKAYAKLRREGYELKLCSLNPHIKKLFTITKLDRTISIHDSVEEAIMAYKNKQEVKSC